jgi:hypothetical protein
MYGGRKTEGRVGMEMKIERGGDVDTEDVERERTTERTRQKDDKPEER